MRENPSQIRSEMREVMSGFPRSYARVLPCGGNRPGAVVSVFYSISDRGELVKPNNPAAPSMVSRVRGDVQTTNPGTTEGHCSGKMRR